jgi:exosortase A-associated hydrolase 2
VNALFLPGSQGALFGVYYPPSQPDRRSAILHLPAFAEEMNKSRALIAQQARAWSAQGYAVLVIDYFGTGDSEGDFGDARWAYWLQDTQCALDWLYQQGAEQVYLWGLRLGCLLALDFIHHNPGRIARLIAWQAVLNGDLFVGQFLRLRIAAALLGPNAQSEKTGDLKQRILDGEALEVAGYRLNPDLIRPLLALKAEHLDCSSLKRVDVFEISAQPQAAPSLPAQNWLNRLQALSVETSAHSITAAPFWSSQEIASAPELITQTSACLASDCLRHV